MTWFPFVNESRLTWELRVRVKPPSSALSTVQVRDEFSQVPLVTGGSVPRPSLTRKALHRMGVVSPTPVLMLPKE